MPKILQTDQGTNLTSELMRNVINLLGINHKTSTPFHFQTQGKCERQHDTLNERLRIFINENCKDWDVYLPYFQFALNSSQNSTTGYSPFYLNHGREPTFPSELKYGLSEYALPAEIEKRLSKAKEFATQAIMMSQEKQATRYNKKRRDITFNIGEKCLVRRYIKKKSRPLKLQNLYYGPYTIVDKDKKTDVNYLVELRTKKKNKQMWTHVEKLRKFIERDESLLNFSPNEDTCEHMPDQGPDSDDEAESYNDEEIKNNTVTEKRIPLSSDATVIGSEKVTSPRAVLQESSTKTNLSTNQDNNTSSLASDPTLKTRYYFRSRKPIVYPK
ncbi:hypothetical protein Ocin01_13318 [Orchesella cincta]|uniref:Integrase catalytic domain-containing protein n=1 Tax=Orchesella cincta TaxID=48709 RepID=A0A1D2MKD8_ORCCI|nr:hypothetical protein Ocin01_13318 [Orchesella cincta]